MRNILIVLKYEVITTLSKVSFWVMTFLFPAVVIILSLGSQLLVQSNLDEIQNEVPGSSTSQGGPVYAYVDEAGLIQSLPEGLPLEMLNPYADLASAQADLEAGKIDAYMRIPAEYLETRELVWVQHTFNPMSNTPEDFFEYLINYNLLDDPQIASLLSVDRPSTIFHNLQPQPEVSTTEGPSDPGMSMATSYGALFIFFMLLTSSSGLMLSSVSKEKTNRVAEVLLLSLNPRELMAGKLLGLSLVAIFQMLAWILSIMLFLKQGSGLIAGLSQINLPGSFLLWAVLFFTLGFLLYASLMGAIGALAPDLREAGQFTFLLLLPLMVPVFLNTVFVDAPHGQVATILSLVPLTAPTAMLTRLVSGNVPFWQTAASLAGLAVTTYLIVLLSARFFRPETLLSSEALNWRSFTAAVRQAVTRRS
jgi:ABC-2 type transport system permease protein